MLKSNLRLLICLSLVLTTTASVWSHLLTDDGDPIEVSYETESEKGEKELKESEKEFDSFDGYIPTIGFECLPELFAGFQKVGSSSFAPVSKKSIGFYILYRNLKIAC